MAKQSKLKKQYAKERRRVNQLIRRWSKRGFVFPLGVVPDAPKRITEGSIRRLKKIDSDYLRNKSAGWVDKRTGEVLPVETGLYHERKLANERRSRTAKANLWQKQHPNVKAQTITEISLSRLYEYIDQDFSVYWQDERRQVLRAALDNLVTRDGVDAIAERYSDNIDAVQEAIQRAVFESDPAKALSAVQRFIELLSGGDIDKNDMKELEQSFEPGPEDEIIDWEEGL